MTKLQLELLGSPSITLDGAPLRGLRYSKAEALLFYLAVTGRPHSREVLAALLWSDMPDEAARTNLRTVLSKLRTFLSPYLVITRQTLAFNRDSFYSLDVACFVGHLRGTEAEQNSDSLRRAVELYRGDFLEGFFVQEAPVFEEWLLGQRDWLRGLALQALHGLAAYHAAREEYTAARDYLGRLLSLDPWREDAHRHLIRLLAKSGQPDAALAQYQHLRRMLKTELGLEPSVETVHLYEQLQAVKAGDQVQPVAEPLSVSVPKVHNLPVSSSPFVAREVTAEILDVLDNPRCRLLTLNGSGGVGKTRLAAEVASHRATNFKHGAWYVSLASLTLAENLAARITSSLGIASSGAAAPNEELLSYLRHHELLLILDNFEHLQDKVVLLAHILQEAPGVKLLVTSRERLNIQGEWTLSIGGMHYPSDFELKSKNGLVGVMERYSALQLFKQSAQRAKPGLHFTDEDILTVVQICQLVAAVPLAIELAAAWVRTLSLREIHEEISRNLDFLTAPKDAPERHSSIRMVFEHSWNLLAREEQEVLRHSSVFRSGFTREAAFEVADASVSILSSLVDKALFYRGTDGRYWRHVLIKSFVDEKAAIYPEGTATMQERHSTYYLNFLLRHEQVLKGRKQREALGEIEVEMDNVRLAWAWAVEHEREEALERVLPSLETIYALQGRFEEAEASFALAASKLPAKSLTFSRMLIRQGRFSALLGRYEEAKALLQESLVLFRQHRALEDVALALQNLGSTIYYQGAYVEAKPLMLESLALYRKLNDPIGIADNLNNLGNIAELLGEYEQAKRYHWEALALRREIGDYRMIAISLVNLGDVAYRAGEVEEAEAYYEESLILRREIGDRGRIAGSLARAGDVALASGDAAKAENYYREALELSVAIHAMPKMVQALLGVAAVLAQAAREEEAIEILGIIKHHPASPPWYRDHADYLFTKLAAKLPSHVVIVVKARGAVRDVLEVAERVLKSSKATA